jgi:putative transposase
MDWPHAPAHRLEEGGAFMVTCGTYHKEPFFRGGERLTLLTDSLLTLALDFEWMLQAWAVFSNHYHFVGNSGSPGNLPEFQRRLHMVTGRAINDLDVQSGRKVWFQYWDTRLTYEKSYLTRLNYVHNNPVKHGVVKVASQYPWCSAAWFERAADRSFYETVTSFKTDRLNVKDDFPLSEPKLPPPSAPD